MCEGQTDASTGDDWTHEPESDQKSGSDTEIEIFPIAIGRYDHHDDLDVDIEVDRVVELLAQFGGRHDRWAHAWVHRGGDAVDERLRAWAEPREPANSLLYWVGHGWSDGVDASLAHAHSPRDVRTYGITPERLAEPIRGRQATAGDHWAILVVDACQSSRFVDLVDAELARAGGADRVLLIGISGDGGTTLGRFSSALRNSLEDSFKGVSRVPLAQLAEDLERRLPGSRAYSRRLLGAYLLRRSVPVAASLPGPLDTVRHLEEVLEDLTPDQRRHFLVKAQGAEEGEIAWFFEGRHRERAQIVNWLRTTTTGLLVVTGRAGSGKSALLGHILVHSLPELRGGLINRGLIKSLPYADSPPADIFDEVMHLSGLTISDVVRRTARAAGLGPLPSEGSPSAGIANDLDYLALNLQDRNRPFTILADALDEATDPLDLARSVFARISLIAGVRIVVGTRSSTHESPDHPAPDGDNLLQALGIAECSAESASPHRLVSVARDDDAIRRYVSGRLISAREIRRSGLTINGRRVTDTEIEAAACAVADRRREFLFARLAVYELLNAPTLLAARRRQTLQDLLDGDHRDLFSIAIGRLAEHSDAFLPLLRALSLARGRGFPILGGVWSSAASSVAGDMLGQRQVRISDEDIHELLEIAQPYIAVDAEGGQTVYRLAHRTFVEHFMSRPSKSDHRRAERQVGHALIELASENAGLVSPYLSRHLSGHVAQADLWEELAARPRILDSLNVDAVTADVSGTLFGRRRIPPPVAGVIGARQLLVDAGPADRAGIRQLATTIHGCVQVIAEQTTSWGVAAASVGEVEMHLSYAGHEGIVTCVRAVGLPDGRQVVASSGDDGTIRLWDPAIAGPIGPPLMGHSDAVEAICQLPASAGGSQNPARIGGGLLASGGADGTIRIWDPVTGREVGSPIVGHSGTVWSVCPVEGDDGRMLLATAGNDGTIRLWDVNARRQLGPALTGHIGGVRAVCAVPGLTGQPMLVSAGADGTVRRWDLRLMTPVGDPLGEHTGGVWGLCQITGPEGQALVASTGADGQIRVWDPVGARLVGGPMTGHTGSIWGVGTVRLPDGLEVVATAGGDGTVRLWNPALGTQVGSPLSGHPGGAWTACSVAVRGGQTLLVTGGADATVRLWDPAISGQGIHTTGEIGTVFGVCAVATSEGRPLLASTGSEGEIQLWDSAITCPVGTPLRAHTGTVWAVCPLPWADGRTLLASSGADGAVRVWDPMTGDPVGPPMTGHSGDAWEVCAVPWPDGRTLLASSGADGTVRVWDPTTGDPVGPPMTGHAGGVWEICSLPINSTTTLIAATSMERTVRLWDPVTGQAFGKPLVGHSGTIWGVCAITSADQRTLLVTASDDATVRLWDPLTGAPVGEPLVGHGGTVWSACAVPWADGRTLVASAGADGTIRVWDPMTGNSVGHPLKGHTGGVREICAFQTPSGEAIIVSAGGDGTVRLWNPASLKPDIGVPMGGNRNSIDAIDQVCASTGPLEQVAQASMGTLVTWSPRRAIAEEVLDATYGVCSVTVFLDATRNSLVVTGSTDGTLRALSRGADARMSVVQTLHTKHGPALTLRPALGLPSVVLVGTATGYIGSWNLITGHQDGEIPSAHREAVRDLCLLNDVDDATVLASAGQDGLIQLWDRRCWERIGSPMEGHMGWVWKICQVVDGPRGPRIASAGADGTVRLWDLRTQTQMGPPLVGHRDQVRAVCLVVADDGRTLLASGGHDGTIILWDIQTASLVHRIPLGIPVHALSCQPQDEASRARTDGGSTITVGTRGGFVALDISQSLFPHA